MFIHDTTIKWSSFRSIDSLCGPRGLAGSKQWLIRLLKPSQILHEAIGEAKSGGREQRK